MVGATTITWSAPQATRVELHVGSPTGTLFASGGSSGSAPTGPWVTDGMTFYLQDTTGGKVLTAANTLATLLVHVEQQATQTTFSANPNPLAVAPGRCRFNFAAVGCSRCQDDRDPCRQPNRNTLCWGWRQRIGENWPVGLGRFDVLFAGHEWRQGPQRSQHTRNASGSPAGTGSPDSEPKSNPCCSGGHGRHHNSLLECGHNRASRNSCRGTQWNALRLRFSRFSCDWAMGLRRLDLLFARRQRRQRTQCCEHAQHLDCASATRAGALGLSDREPEPQPSFPVAQSSAPPTFLGTRLRRRWWRFT